MIATGNHGNFDSLRVAPRPYERNGGRLIIAPTGAEEDGGRFGYDVSRIEECSA